MKVRIGIANTGKVIEIEMADEKSFRSEMDDVVEKGGLGWFTDTKGRSVGIPAGSIAYVQIDETDGGHSVGFAPAG